MSRGRVAVIQFPGVNCEAETCRAIERSGLEAEVFRPSRSPGELAGFDAFVLPGGFSHQDRVRAGAIAAKDAVLDALAAEAERGRPILGICNGAQVLIEAGLVPGGGGVQLALARNRMPDRDGYYSRWVICRVERSACVFTSALPQGTLLPLPVAHGEGRFTSSTRGRMARLLAAGQVPLRYAAADGRPAEAFPDSPNGAELAAAGVCNAAGNVLAMMPHPERAQDLGAVARSIAGPWAEARDRASSSIATATGGGPGLLLFEGLRRHMELA